MDKLGILNASGGDGSDIGACEARLFLGTSITGAGGLLKSPAQDEYEPDSTVTLTAYPASGWDFSYWFGDVSSSNNPLPVVMTRDKSITANFIATASACAPAPSGLVGWWPGASNANDIIGNNNGTLSNGVAFAAGKVGQAFSFDGVDDYFKMPHPSSFDFGATSSFSVAFWFRTTVSSRRMALMEKVSATSPYAGYYFDVNQATANQIKFVIGDNVQNLLLSYTNSQVSDGQWRFVVGRVDRASQTTSLFFDGAPVATGSTTNVGSLGNFNSLFIGNRYGFDIPFEGGVDEFDIYNRALTAGEITAIYNAGSAGKCLTPLYITSVNKSGANLNLSWLTQPNVTYQVQYKTNLNAATPWTAVSGDVTATNATASKTDVVPANAPQRFYRVEMFR